MVKAEKSRRLVWLAAFFAAAALLTLPALYNGFPLLFPDTEAYMKVAYGHSWTLDRSGFYGLFMKPAALMFPGVVGPWLVIVAQCSITAAILLMAVRQLAPGASSIVALSIIALCCVLTSVAWHSAQLMPDTFAGPLVLSVWLAASRDFDRPGTALLWLATAFMALTHYTYLGIAAVTAATTIAACKWFGASFKEVAKRALAAGAMLAAVIGIHLATNGLLVDRWAVSPTGSWFLFARLNEDGLVPLWLDRHCGKDAPADLCEIRSSLPRDSQELLWSKTSPFYPHIHGQIGSAEYWRWMDMLGIATRGSISEHPLKFASSTIEATGRQLVSYAVLDDKCPRVCHSPAFIRFNPAVADDIRNSRQLQKTIDKGLIRPVVGSATSLALLLLLPFLWYACRKRDKDAIILLCAVTMSLIANAAMAGALSDVQDRYQSRIVWIVPFVELLLLVRWSPKLNGPPLPSEQSGSRD